MDISPFHECPQLLSSVVSSSSEDLQGEIHLSVHQLTFFSKQEERKIANHALHEIAMSASLHHRQLVGFIGLVENATDTLSDRSFLDPIGYVMQYFPGEQLEVLLDELNQKSESPCYLFKNN